MSVSHWEMKKVIIVLWFYFTFILCSIWYFSLNLVNAKFTKFWIDRETINTCGTY